MKFNRKYNILGPCARVLKCPSFLGSNLCYMKFIPTDHATSSYMDVDIESTRSTLW